MPASSLAGSLSSIANISVISKPKSIKVLAIV
jgi:hypothetical protein